MQSAALMEYEN